MQQFDTKSLITWFEKEQREFPWRDKPTPYAVWVSEVMLQQTRAEVVVPFFERWMRRFPSIASLAAAQLEDVIKNWEGLGYYSRARNLHKAAQFLVEYYEGELPSDPEDLKKIKGIGPYTLGAIRNFAFKQRAAAVDGNVLRVISRYFTCCEDIAKVKTQQKLRELVQGILPQAKPWVFSEALIELGALICTKQPKCCQCPLKMSCGAYQQGLTQKLPVKSKAQTITKLMRQVVLVLCGDACLVKKGRKGEIMQDLYEFPYFETEEQNLSLIAEAVWLDKTVYLDKLAPVRQFFTRYRADLIPHVLRAEQRFMQADFIWIPLNELQQLPFSSGHKKIYQQLVRQS